MRVMRVTSGRREPSAEAYPSAASGGHPPMRIFVGEVDLQTILDAESSEFRLVEVAFKDGARNKLHTHTTDQILVITEGNGIVATRDERHEVGVGDIALIPAHEPHWHGARPGSDMTHLAVTGKSVTTIVGD